jgi:superfamily I DNA and RNA helicase
MDETYNMHGRMARVHETSDGYIIIKKVPSIWVLTQISGINISAVSHKNILVLHLQEKTNTVRLSDLLKYWSSYTGRDIQQNKWKVTYDLQRKV